VISGRPAPASSKWLSAVSTAPPREGGRPDLGAAAIEGAVSYPGLLSGAREKSDTASNEDLLVGNPKYQQYRTPFRVIFSIDETCAPGETFSVRSDSRRYGQAPI
jgi:hypothetical protein